MDTEGQTAHHEPWNKGKIVGQKAPFKRVGRDSCKKPQKQA